MFLISGSCIGAGMLGLPILTGQVGFFPSLVMFVAVCFFMTVTALLFVEVKSWFPEKTNLITMASSMLGFLGKAVCWLLYLFLFYALLVAYIAGSGNHVSFFFQSQLNLMLPSWVGSFLFAFFFGSIVYLGTTSVDRINRLFMVGKLIAYLGLIFTGMHCIEWNYLTKVHLQYLFTPLPILVVSFGFHNMIPTLFHYLGGDIKRTRLSIIGGAVFSLCVYLFWQLIVLGSLPLEGKFGLLSSYHKGLDAAQALKNCHNLPSIGNFAQALAFFAIVTSFSTQLLGLIHFLVDGLKISSKDRLRENIWICLLALVPPLLLAMFYPKAFYIALNFAGGFCAVALFGMVPVLMVWIGRYRRDLVSTYTVFGGKKLLQGIFGASLLILTYQVFRMAL